MNMSISVHTRYKHTFLQMLFAYMSCWGVFFIVIGVSIDTHKLNLGAHCLFNSSNR